MILDEVVLENFGVFGGRQADVSYSQRQEAQNSSRRRTKRPGQDDTARCDSGRALRQEGSLLESRQVSAMTPTSAEPDFEVLGEPIRSLSS